MEQLGKLTFERGTGYVIKCDGEPERIQASSIDGGWKLHEMQAQVGGPIEIVPGFSHRHEGFILLVDENGTFKKDNQLNLTASSMARMPLLGNALLIREADFH